MRVRLLLLLTWALVAAALPASMSAADARPNVLLVVTDDEAIGLEEATPNIVNWFGGGSTFTQAFATTPLCCPARASIMSGRYSHNHKVKRNKDGHKLEQRKTLQAQLRRAGYNTAIAGKFLNDWDADRRPPHFDRWTLSRGYGRRFVVDGKDRRVPYGSTFAFDQARTYVNAWESDDDTPWFMYVAPWAPHSPYTAEAKYAKESFPWDGTPATAEADRSDKPGYVRKRDYTKEQGERRRESQLRVMRSVDDAFMRTVDRLAVLGELDNTLVIYVSDNGFMWAEHGLMGKIAPYLGAVRVPLRVRGPGVPAATDDRLVGNIDIAPTIYSRAGVTPTYAVDGKDLFSSARDHLLLERVGPRLKGLPAWQALISSEHHLIRYGDTDEYYDLVTDPYELENSPSLAPASLVARLGEVGRCAGASCP